MGEFVYDRKDFENYLGFRHVKPMTALPNGTIYWGEWKGKPPDKKKPVGRKDKHKPDERHGRGVLFYRSGGIYEGYWMDDKPHDKGR